MNKIVSEKTKRRLILYNKLWIDIMDTYAEAGYNTESKIMYYLLEKEQIGGEAIQTELCNVWRINKQTLNSAVKRMEKAGYLTSEVSALDRRKRIMKLTDAGRELAKKEFLNVGEAEILAFENFADGEADEFLRLMKKYSENLKMEIQKRHI